MALFHDVGEARIGLQVPLKALVYARAQRSARAGRRSRSPSMRSNAVIELDGTSQEDGALRPLLRSVGAWFKRASLCVVGARRW
jgi:hypothetical protein